MEGSPSPKQGKYPPRRERDTGLLGCFRSPRPKRLQAPSSPDTTSLSSSKEDFFSSDDPDLVDPLFTAANSTAFKNTNCMKTSLLLETEASEESFVFSLPALSDALLEYSSFRTLSDPLLSTFSYNGGVHVETSRRGSKGHPQPLLPPLSKAVVSRLLLSPPKEYSSPEHRSNSGLFASPSTTSSTGTTTRRESEVGSWSIRRGRAATLVFGLPLPSPAVATKFLPGLESYEFEDLLHGSREFSPECCMEKDAFGAVYRTWVQGAGGGKLGRQMAVVRLNVNENQTWKEWKSDVQMLAQLPDSNICLIKGYCAHEDVDVHSVKVVSERLLVFDQSPNGTFYDYLCGSRSKTQHLDWFRRISIVLGAARGLMYLHDRAPLQIVYREFKASSVLLDKDYTPRLAGYGLVVTSSSNDRKSPLSSVMKTSQAYAKSNVWSFGVVLVELLTGKSSLGTTFQSSDTNFIRWAKPFLKDEVKLALILDPRLKSSKCLIKGAFKVAELALRCLKTKAPQRTSMSRVVVALKSIREDHYCGGAGRAPHHNNSSTVVASPEQPRASFGGLSFLELEQISKSGDVLVLSTEGRPSVSVSSEDAQAMSASVALFCTGARQSVEVVDYAKTGGYRFL